MIDQAHESEADEARAARKRAWSAEAKIYSRLADEYESVAAMNWPDAELVGVGAYGEVDKTTLDAIQDNLPFNSPSWPPYSSLDELGCIREQSRLLATYNEYAKGALKNRCNFIVGYGHTVSIAAKEGFELTDEEKTVALDVIRAFEKRNNWRKRQRSNQRRLDRDGEVFIRKFRGKEGLILRYVEPEDVVSPDEEKNEYPFGIVYNSADVEDVRGYYVRTGDAIDLVPANEIQHRKLDDDLDCPRGVPLLMACRRSLAAASKIMRNVTALTKIQSHFALIRKHQQATMTAIQSMVNSTADVRVTNPISGQAKYGREYGPGGVYDMPAGVEVDFPSQSSRPEQFLPPVAAQLRAAAASVCMAEYMFTADASNANYSSTMMAGGPPVRAFEAAQWDMIDDDRALYDEELALAVARGAIPEDLLARIDVKIDAPDPAVNDKLQQAQARVMDKEIGVSPQTLIAESGRDPETERKNTEEWIEQTGGVAGAGFPLMANQPAPEPEPVNAPAN